MKRITIDVNKITTGQGGSYARSDHTPFGLSLVPHDHPLAQSRAAHRTKPRRSRALCCFRLALSLSRRSSLSCICQRRKRHSERLGIAAHIRRAHWIGSLYPDRSRTDAWSVLLDFHQKAANLWIQGLLRL